MVQSNPRPDLPLGERLQQDLKNDLIAGLLVVIPLATTIWLSTIVSRFVLAFLTSIPKQFNPFITLNPLLQDLINLALGLTVPLMGILLIGLMARNIVGRWLLEFGEGTLSRIPLAGSVYKTLKQLLETVLGGNSARFRRVVLVEYPREGLFSVGFVTGEVGPSLQSDLETPLLSVFIPTAPNPTTGWYTLVPEGSVRELNISVEEAFRTIISAGIVNPDEQEARLPPRQLAQHVQQHRRLDTEAGGKRKLLTKRLMRPGQAVLRTQTAQDRAVLLQPFRPQISLLGRLDLRRRAHHSVRTLRHQAILPCRRF